jgi:non-specific serine/threonine protein kinase/serine/threonine-protein kinase
MGTRSTSRLSSAQISRVDQILDQLLELPEDRRVAAWQDLSTEDPQVNAEVTSLLTAIEASTGFLTTQVDRNETRLDAAVGSRFGRWRVTRRVGSGGMGDVYEAVRAEGDFEQRVAIKVLQSESGTALGRFQSERQILARLMHPGIARLYDGGVTDQQRPFMVMEFVEGQPITEYCRSTHASLAGRLQLFTQVCEAVAFAHQNLIVHRDLKPSNILVTAEGAPKLLDFGIAKLLDAQDSRVTIAASTPMTPSCAAPEQLTGEPITTATDVYALGLLLFELLTGTHPWVLAGTPILQAMRQVLERPAPLPSSVADEAADAPVPARLIRGDLDAIVAKALRREPVYRYTTVAAMQRDVVRAQNGEPIEAREGARLYTVGRNLRRYRWAVAGTLAVVVSLASGLGVASWQAERAAVERDAARRDAAREEAVRYSLTRLFRTAIEEQGNQSPTAQAPTAKSMIDNSAQRVLREYRDHPQQAGQIVLTLADLYSALEDVNGAGTLLEGFLAEANPDADPAALADARQKLANIELLRGHVDRADELLKQAEVFWAQTPNRYQEERLEGLTVRARLLRNRGKLDAAIAATEEAIRQRIALSGRDHRETAILYNSLAISLTAANRLNEALDAYHETTRIYGALGLGEGLDAQIILANTGTLELRIGHLTEAETLLKRAIDRERALAGDSAAVAAAMGYYGKVLDITNRDLQAVKILKEAVDLGTHYAGASSPLALQNQLFLVEAQSGAGDRVAAHATDATVYENALKQYGAAHLLTLRAQLDRGQLELAEGNLESARADMVAVISGLRMLGMQGEPHLARALLNLGEVQTRLRRNAEAEAALRESVALREKHPEDVWELAEARERLGEATASRDRAAAAELLTQAARDLEDQLGATHPQTLRAKSALANLRV